MSVQISSLQVKALAKNLRKAMSYGYVSELLQEIVTSPELVKQLNSAIGKKKNKPVKQTSIDKLIGAACGFDSFESALNSNSVKKLNIIEGNEGLMERLNSWRPPKNRVVFMEQNLPLFMDTFKELTEHQSMQLLLNDHFLFYDANDMYFRTNTSEFKDVDLDYGLITMSSCSSGKGIFGSLSSTIFRQNGRWTIIDESKSLSKKSNYMINTLEMIVGFLHCAAGAYVANTEKELLWFRASNEYEQSFLKLKDIVKNDPLRASLVQNEELNNSEVYNFLTNAIEETKSVARLLYNYSDEQFLYLVSSGVAESDENLLSITRRVALSESERDLLVVEGILEDIPFNDDDNLSWEIEYLLNIKEGCDIELSIVENPSLFQCGIRVNYSKWVNGGVYSPRSAKVIWDDLNSLLPKIDGIMAIINKPEIVSKVALLTINRA